MPNDIKTLLHEIRNRGTSADLTELINEAKALGIPFGETELKSVLPMFSRSYDAPLIPDWLLAFVRGYMGSLQVDSMLDPSSNLGSFIVPFIPVARPKTAYAIDVNKSAIDIASEIFDTDINWLNLGRIETFKWLNETPQRFDLIVSFPPMGVTINDDDKFNNSFEQSGLRDNWGNLVLLNSCLKLSDDGVGLFVVPRLFFTVSKVYKRLADFGLYLDAALHLPSKLFRPLTLLDTYLVIVRRQKPEALFVAELTSNEKRNKEVLKHLKGRKSAKTFGIGILTDSTKFHGYPALEAERRIHDLAQELGLKPVSLDEIKEGDLKHISSKENDGLEEENAIYVPERSGRVYTSIAELTANNYYRIKLQRGKVSAEYLSRLLNSQLGEMLLSRIETGSTIPYIRQSNLENLEVFLPSSDVQTSIVEADIAAATFIRDVTELRDQLWTSPQVDSEVAKRISVIIKGETQQRERFEDWIDSLPFPLASILWAYHATNDDFKRYRLLQRYFEAVTQFLAIVLLSGFYGDSEWLTQEKSLFLELKTDEKSDKKKVTEKLKTASFGTWLSIVERLMKVLQTHLNNPEQRYRCERLFGTSSEVLLKLFPNEVIDVLRKTNGLRNEWRGHGGIDDTVATTRLQRLQTHLVETREILGRHWEQYRLLKPEANRKVAGAINQDVEWLVGHRPFITSTIPLEEPLDTTYLYLHTPNEPRALAVQPLLHVLTKLYGEQTAAYFYSRIKEDKAMFISHHFDKAPDIEDSFKETFDMLKHIRALSEEES